MRELCVESVLHSPASLGISVQRTPSQPIDAVTVSNFGPGLKRLWFAFRQRAGISSHSITYASFAINCNFSCGSFAGSPLAHGKCYGTPAVCAGQQGVDTRTIQDYLGHKSIQHTVRYTEMAPDRFRGFCPDPLPHPQEHKRGRGSDLSTDSALDLKGHRLTEDNEEGIAELMRVGLSREQAKDLILGHVGRRRRRGRRLTANV